MAFTQPSYFSYRGTINTVDALYDEIKDLQNLLKDKKQDKKDLEKRLSKINYEQRNLDKSLDNTERIDDIICNIDFNSIDRNLETIKKTKLYEPS